MISGEVKIRVRYAETDRMGLLHHANYLVYFEEARVALLRELGYSYRDIEDQGFFLVLTQIEVKYRRPVYFDDALTVRVVLERATMVRLDHRYEVLRDGTLVAEGSSTLACVDRAGKPQALPAALRHTK
jgi:acyl-CoA thioester hydrolase